MGFQEKNAWACGLSILVVFAPYFWVVFAYPMAHVGLFGLAVLGLVVLLAGFHIVNALATAAIRKSGDTPAPDEMDHMVELRAAKFAGVVLAMAVMLWTLGAMLGVPMLGVHNITAEHAATPATTPLAGGTVNAEDFAIRVTQAMVGVHLLFAGFVISNLVYYGAIVVGYRRLVRG